MAETMTRSPAVEAMHNQRMSLNLVATLARRLSRRFGEPGSEQDWADFLIALDRERTTRSAYRDAISARRSELTRAGGAGGQGQ
jgi:tRNA uridine 5-carbamoylmethylation protein Kti12